MKTNSNINYLLLSVIITLIIWCATTMQIDPLIEGSVSVPIKVRNSDLITDSGNVYGIEEEKTDGSLYARVTYYVRTSKASEVKQDNISAYIDCKNLRPLIEPNIDNTGRHQAKVNVDYLNEIKHIRVNTIEPQNIHIFVDGSTSKDFPITYKSDESLGSGYVLGKVVLSNDTATITGLARDIDKIDTVGIVISLAEKKAEIAEIASLQYFDKDGNVLTGLNVVSSVPNVGYNAQLNIAQTIKIEQGYVGGPADGYGVKSVEIVPSVVTATYPLANFNANKAIVLPVIDISGMDTPVEKEVDISGLLGADTKIIGENTKVNVKIDIVSNELLFAEQGMLPPKSNVIVIPKATPSELIE